MPKKQQTTTIYMAGSRRLPPNKVSANTLVSYYYVAVEGSHIIDYKAAIAKKEKRNGDKKARSNKQT